MFYKWNDSCVRLTGRWGKNPDWASCCATTTGARVEFAFAGRTALMHFDVLHMQQPYPHLWIQVDDGVKVEAPLDAFLRISADDGGTHKVCVILKGAVETQHRWHHPLVGKMAFLGFEAERCGVLPEDTRPVMEFIGDSITEGVLIDDVFHNPVSDGQFRRVFQDDVCANYAWLTAEKLHCKPVIMGYGATGLTKSGNGGVPKGAEAYPYAFCDCPVNVHADYVVVNHGGNDRQAGGTAYLAEYEKLLRLIRSLNKTARIICVGAFCGAFADVLSPFVEKYNLQYNEQVLFIDTSGWIPKDPLHPTRESHRKIAELLAASLKEKLDL